MLARGSFAIVVVPDDDPFDARVAVFGSDLGDAALWTVELVLNLVGFAILSVDSADQAVF